MAHHGSVDFRSDNVSGAHPDILEAIARASRDSAAAYGADAWSARLTARFSEIFEREGRIEELQQLLTTADVLRSGPRVKAVQAEIAEQQASLKGLYEHWEEASELNW